MLAASVKHKAGLKKISVERIRQELMKLIIAPRALNTLKVMAASGILKVILPYTEDWRVFGRLPPDPLLRLFQLAKNPLDLKDDLRLSNEEGQRLERINAAPELSPALRMQEQQKMLYQLGSDAWGDAVNLSWARSRASLTSAKWAALLDLPQNWPVPQFPVTGKDLVASGVAPGPALGEMLQQLEDWWLACDFVPTREELLLRIEHGK
jgi:poly(A) polymerase